jgi:hypothetical protein
MKFKFIIFYNLFHLKIEDIHVYYVIIPHTTNIIL